MSKLAVVALGGNALLQAGQKGTIEEQEKNVYEACKNVIGLIKQGYNVVIGHGNGPQVGNVMLQHEAGYKAFDIPKQPLDICVAETQGSIGYMIEQQMKNALTDQGLDNHIISVITQVLVDTKDDAFANPNKPVGPYYPEEDLQPMLDKGWKFQEDPRGRGWRRVVPSPKPIEISNWEVVEDLARAGNVVVAVGGGGIPCYLDEKGHYKGVEAVIDKDLASATLAKNIKADAFYILTDVSNVFVNFNTPDQKKLEVVSLGEIKQHLADGQFTEGSMAPKVRAGIQFVENGGTQTVITEASLLKHENEGTRIVK